MLKKYFLFVFFIVVVVVVLFFRSREGDSKLMVIQESYGELQKDIINLLRGKAEMEKELKECKSSVEVANNGWKAKMDELERESTLNKNRIIPIIKERDDLISRYVI